MKKTPDIINPLWNVCGQMEVGTLLTCGSGIIPFKSCPIFYRTTLTDDDEVVHSKRLGNKVLAICINLVLSL